MLYELFVIVSDPWQLQPPRSIRDEERCEALSAKRNFRGKHIYPRHLRNQQASHYNQKEAGISFMPPEILPKLHDVIFNSKFYVFWI